MGFYRPCTNCVREKAPCPRRERIATGIKGLGLTSVKFRCAEREPIFTIGQRVTVTWLVRAESDCWYDDGAMWESWPATVIAERGSKFQIVVDDVDSDEGTPARNYIKSETLYCNVTAGKLNPLDEPPRSVCGACGTVRGLDGTVAGCWGYDREAGGGFSYTPHGCLKAQIASVDTHPAGGDSEAAPFMGSAVGASRDAQPPHSESSHV